MKAFTSVLTVVLSAVAIVGCDKKESAPSSTPGTPSTPAATVRIAVIPKGTTHVFWKSVEAGARKAAEEAKIQMIWKGPLTENDRAEQIAIVEQFVSEGVNGIVLAPLDTTALLRPVQAARAKKMPVVIIDSALKGEPGTDFDSFVATNNKQGGIIAGEELAKELGGKGKVVLLRYLEGSASTMDREAGFLEVMAKYPDIKVIVSNRFGGATAGESKNTSLDLIDRLKEADGIFCSNEPTVYGMLLALRENHLTGRVKFVGFDASAELIKALNAGEIQALVAQNPTKMGYEGVKTMAAVLKGEKVEPSIDTGVALITKENVDSPEIKSMLGLESK